VEAGVAVFVGPKGEGEGSEVIDERNGVAVFCEIDGANVELAGFAGFDAHVRELLGDVDGELVFGFFAAGGAEKAAKVPFAHTEGAEKEALAAVSFETKRAKHRQGAAARAEARSSGGRGHG